MKTFSVQIHHEDGSYWAEVPNLPGVFAAGDDLDELIDSLKEGLTLVLGTDAKTASVELESAVLSVE